MSGTIFGLNDTIWHGSRSMFFWTLESVARRTEHDRVRDYLLELSEAGVNWLNLEDFTEREHLEVLHLLHATADVGRRELEPDAHLDALVEQLEELRALE
ncbi:hypothetical protein ACFO3K_06055 [Cellulomonas algicola]|uniref:Uncharacterized protein n=1 Tax=Cellulomonas algicola TaxID=2071633 RepID=A0A401V2X5_9CELL|nr:hypothetical protein [Cellulomonas algicola]GCD21258.1 hypothetical protein CTKZ_28200 [Cellulomonas algicola]